ncbi:MAG TPA: 2-oxoglutarate and iron-dependent oxygenase domain-containing protein [Steroidobacteraceae bacterium]|nr:2-oxoglutarate and iron-dependent oxygenase domain-containing protein [Steroidobacteraceae bacterium]
MASFSDPPRLPIIDLSLFELGEPWRDHVAAQVDWAASEFGFFYVIGHGVESGTIESLLQLSRSFFRMGDEIKQRIHMSRGGRAWRGYFPVGGELTSGRPDLKEGLYFGEELPENDVRVRAGTPLHGRNLFPELPGFRGAVLDYMTALTGLGHKLMSSIGRGLRVGDNFFVDHYTGLPTQLFRIFNYPGTPERQSPNSYGVGEHTDYGLLTLLYQDEVGGLQVKYGDSWIDVPYVPGSLVINVGDMLERLTAGRYTSALHRVINRSRQSRISMPFFFDPGFDAVLQPIPGVGPRVIEKARRDRWDGLDLTEVDGTYGDYLLGKVSKVFPDLGQHHLQVS